MSRTIQAAAGVVFLAAGVMTFRSLAARAPSRVSLLLTASQFALAERIARQPVWPTSNRRRPSAAACGTC